MIVPRWKGSCSCSAPVAVGATCLRKLGCGSGHTAWRRLREWQDAGVWDRLHQVILIELREAEVLDWTRCCVDAVAVRAKRGRAYRSEPYR